MMENPQKAIVYVTRDIERALGMEPKDGYFIISNYSEYGREIQVKYPDTVWLIQDTRGTLDTYDLLLLPEVADTISKYKADVVVFQNTARIERLAIERGWNLLNPSAQLAQKVEEKISQIEFLGKDATLLPPHRVTKMKDVSFEGKKFVLQFNHSHTGQGTYVIDSTNTLRTLAEKFPERECRVVDFIEGPVFTVNVIATPQAIHVGNLSYQITGIPPFTDLPFSTIGNDWALPHTIHYAKAKKETETIAVCIGTRMASAGWRGLFGIDVIYDKVAEKTYLLEINARQPASAVFESLLQKEIGTNEGVSIIEAHYRALLGVQDIPGLKRITSGAQIVKRLTHISRTVDMSKLSEQDLTVISYETDIHNKELFRIQTREGIMENHNVLNALGMFIASTIQ